MHKTRGSTLTNTSAGSEITSLVCLSTHTGRHLCDYNVYGANQPLVLQAQLQLALAQRELQSKLCIWCTMLGRLQTPNTVMPVFKEIDKNHGKDLDSSHSLSPLTSCCEGLTFLNSSRH